MSSRSKSTKRPLTLEEDIQSMYNHYAVEATKWIIGPMPIDEFLAEFLLECCASEKETHRKKVSGSAGVFEGVPVKGRNMHELLVCNESFCM